MNEYYCRIDRLNEYDCRMDVYDCRIDRMDE